jgi:flavin reductase (DIM6/NTAB) family NADH-FMN oxidoreductase RutF/rubredoxin
MDKKALYNLSYGVFMLATKVGDKVNGCITNTCMQVASDPVRIAIACINTNLTCEMIKQSGVFSLSILDTTCSFDTIKHFGMQSGRNVDKFEDLPLPEDVNGMPYMGWGANAVISAHVVSSQDLGSHTLFVAEVDDAQRLSAEPPMTYAYYQSDVKPKPAAVSSEKKITGWRCKICGYVYKGEKLPADFVCPLCGHDASDFEPVYA